MVTESNNIFEILRDASLPFDSFVSERTPENPHPFEAIIKTCNEKYGVEETLTNLEKLLYNTNNSETRNEVADALCYVYEDRQDLWLEMLTKFIISDTADYYNYAYLSNHIIGFDVDTREFYKELYDRLPKNSRKWSGVSGKIISLDAQNPKIADILHIANYEEWDYKKTSQILTFDRYADLSREQFRECFKFAKNHPLANNIIITTCNKLLNGDLK